MEHSDESGVSARVTTWTPLPPIIPKKVKSITVAFNLPIPLWEKITRYQAQKQMLLEEAVISLLEIHPNLDK